MHSPSALTELSSLNLAGTLSHDPVLVDVAESQHVADGVLYTVGWTGKLYRAQPRFRESHLS